MDSFDREILSELELHGFQKSKVLAKRFNTSDRTIRRRISAMTENGIFEVIAVPNPVLLGCGGWAKIGIKVRPMEIERVASQLVTDESIYFVARSIGRFDFIIAVNFETIEELSQFINSTLTGNPNIQNTETMLLNCPRKYYNFSWPVGVGVSGPPSSKASKTRCVVDEIDRKILNILKKDGNVSNKDIKQMLGLAEVTLYKHIKNMVKNDVYRLEVAPNPSVLEYEVWATIGMVIAGRSAHEVIDNLIENPSVYLASASIGRFNIVISIRLHDVDSFTNYLNTELTKIKEISSYESFVHTKPLKYHNVTW